MSINTLSNIAALQAQSWGGAPPDIVSLTYKEVAGDGIANLVYKSTDTTSSDNGLSIIVDADGNRWYAEANRETHLQNFQPKFLQKTRARIDCCQAIVAFIGDSTTMGYGIGGNNYKLQSYPYDMALITSAAGISTSGENIWGSMGATTMANFTAIDQRCVGHNWTIDTSLTVPGGWPIRNNSDNTTFEFTPNGNVTAFDVWYINNSGFGVFSVQVDGGATTNVTPAGSGSLLTKFSVTGLGAASHTIKIRRVSGDAHFVGITARNGIQNQFWNMGWSSSDIGVWTVNTQPYNPVNALDEIDPTLTIINLGINDWNTGTALATFETNYQALITAAKNAGSEVMIVCPNPSDFTHANKATQDTYRAVLYKLAYLNDCAVVDLSQHFISQAVANASGLMFDGVHPNALGYVYVCRAFDDALLRK